MPYHSILCWSPPYGRHPSSSTITFRHICCYHCCAAKSGTAWHDVGWAQLCFSGILSDSSACCWKRKVSEKSAALLFLLHIYVPIAFFMEGVFATKIIVFCSYRCGMVQYSLTFAECPSSRVKSHQIKSHRDSLRSHKSWFNVTHLRFCDQEVVHWAFWLVNGRWMVWFVARHGEVILSYNYGSIVFPG